MKPTLLIVDDDEEIRTQMKWALTQDYDVLLAEDRPTALETFRSTHPALTLLDLGLPPRPSDPEEGFAALSEIVGLDRTAKIIVVTGQAEKQNALRAVGEGAYDFLCKPVQMDELKLLLKRCLYLADLEREYRELQQSQAIDGFEGMLGASPSMQQVLTTDGFEGMLGASPSMQKVFAAVRKVATTDAPVLLLGESGTGKEMVALAIHRRSARKDGPFVAINCSAIPETLLESELFGHEKGAFTGAHQQRKGRIESAAGGTLFLDEIGELPAELQVKLLRFLQEQRLQRVGGRQDIEIDARVIAATNADLKEAIQHETFREDLYYRLAVVVIGLPPLRDRADDIRLLAQTFLQRSAAQAAKEHLAFDHEALRALDRHPWPGNVRELENRVKRAVIMTDGKRVTAQDLELAGTPAALPGASLKEAREAVEREMIQQALRRHSGKIAPAAAELGVSRPTFYELMEKLAIKRAEPHSR